MAISLEQSGANSATFLIKNTERLTETEWALLPAGKLSDLLNRSYLTEEGESDPAAFALAYAKAGGLTTFMPMDTFDSTGRWSLATGGIGDATKGTPVCTPAVVAGYGTVVRIQTAYSASA